MSISKEAEITLADDILKLPLCEHSRLSIALQSFAFY